MPTKSNHHHLELKPEQLKWKCPPDLIPAETTEEVEPIEGIIGQERAIKALKLGVELFSPGYNIFVCGLSGTGKATTVKTILEKFHPTAAPLKDYCYVYNFHDEDRPTLLTFARGQGLQFKHDIDEAVNMLRNRIPRIFEDEQFVKQKAEIIDEYNQKEGELFSEFEQKISKDGFVLGKIQEGQLIRPELMPKIGDKTFLINDLMSAVEQELLTAEQAQTLVEQYNAYRNDLQDIFRQGVNLTRFYQKKVADHEAQAASFVANAILEEATAEYTEEKVRKYVKDLTENILENIDRIRKADAKAQSSEEESEEDEFIEYQVNLLLDNSPTEGCPVIIETTPSFVNLFGTIEKAFDSRGFWYTNFTRIKAGSLLRADGGYLVINAFDALTEPGVWKGLQRVLLNRKLEIQGIDSYFQLSASIIKPEPIDINVKVIMVGNNEIYSLLDNYEHDFKKIFKVKADFDYEMPNSDEAVKQYTALIRKLCTDEGLKHFDKTAIAAVIEFGARLAESQMKLTTRFSEIADIIREANYWCAQNSNTYVTEWHVHKAIDESYDRHALYEEKMQEMIKQQVLLIDVEGERIGQLNGLAVYGGTRYSFGKPTRITASIGVGEAGIINIEREARMSGNTHDKGILILAGYMREKFAQEQALTLSASVCFEQSYSGVDGDSASSTEIYALLSALSGLALTQSIGVTGSVNQKGDIQPIGGVNEKVEGFFSVCKERGLTGNQGVMIPKQNVLDLMLKEEILEAVRKKKFHVWAISNITEGIEILTGVPAGAQRKDGKYDPHTVFGKVERRLTELAEQKNAKDKPKKRHTGKKK